MRLPPLHAAAFALAVLVFAVQSHAQQPRAVPRVAVGPWRVASSVIAPWAVADKARLDRAAYLTSIVQLRAALFSGLGPFACERPRYEQTAMPPEGLFQGNLPAPTAAAARALGFAAGAVHGVRVTCASGMFEFHAVDASHLLVAIDNVIWTLDRSPGALAAATTPAGVVQRLLEAHFAFDMGFDSLTVRHVRPFLTGGLAARIAAYFAAPPPRDVVPAIDGDPFTDAQEYPTRFSVQRATVTGARAAVVVRFADGYASRTMQYQLRSGPAGWRVDNIIYPGGGTFTGLLRMKAD